MIQDITEDYIEKSVQAMEADPAFWEFIGDGDRVDEEFIESHRNYSGRDARLLRGCDPPTWLVERGVTFHALLRQRRA